jgi:hypothetical protein
LEEEKEAEKRAAERDSYGDKEHIESSTTGMGHVKEFTEVVGKTSAPKETAPFKPAVRKDEKDRYIPKPTMPRATTSKKRRKGSTMGIFDGAHLSEVEEADFLSKPKFIGEKYKPYHERSHKISERRHYVSKGPRSKRDADGESGEMNIVQPRLNVRQNKVAVGNSPRPKCSTEGSYIRRPDRFCLDKAIFSKRMRGGSHAMWGGGCTILVDVSGSMSLDADDIESIVTDAGGYATVATYSGSRSEGWLTIVARDEYRCSNKDMKPRGYGNIIDEPALEWLARQPLPRVWICDGKVTGKNDEFFEGVTARCKAITRGNQIVRVHNIHAGLEYMTKMRGTSIQFGEVK